MASSSNHDVVELFGRHTGAHEDWANLVSEQECPYTARPCFKVRKSDSSVAIGTCSVRIRKERVPLAICPNRLLENHQVFLDCIHLLRRHEPGNQLHIVPEVSVPGGSVDYFLVSAKNENPVDFVGIEFQTLDTTGTVWPARQRFLRSVGLDAEIAVADADKSYGVNWKMTAKTILMQMHHKTETFEVLGRHLVLVVQDLFLNYMADEFNFGHLAEPVEDGDSLHFHAYELVESGPELDLQISGRRSTNAVGIAAALDLGVAATVEESAILGTVSSKMSERTRWNPL